MNGATVQFRVIDDLVSSVELRRMFFSDDKTSGILAEAAKIAAHPSQTDASSSNTPEPTSKLYPIERFAKNDMADDETLFIPLILCDERTSIQRKGN